MQAVLLGQIWAKNYVFFFQIYIFNIFNVTTSPNTQKLS
jgi:hypothetical protein